MMKLSLLRVLQLVIVTRAKGSNGPALEKAESSFSGSPTLPDFPGGRTVSLQEHLNRPDGTPSKFVRTSQGQACDERWTSWPAMQESAAAGGNILMFRIFPSIGNLFIILEKMMLVSRLLEIALVLDCERFPGFRAAFDPSEISWDLDPKTITSRASSALQDDDSPGLHAFKFADGLLLLSDSRLLLLAHKLNLPEDSVAQTAEAVERGKFKSLKMMSYEVTRKAVGPDPCAWNMLLRRSSTMLRRMATQNPWSTTNTTSSSDDRPKKYVAWHIRTSDGESASSFNQDVHRYIFHEQRSDSIFPLFLAATKSAEEECPSAFPAGEQDTPIYISSNSKEMARNCSIGVAQQGVLPGVVDLGVAGEDGHTAFSRNPNTTAANAFMDYLYLMDADIILRSGSSFSGTVATMKGMRCQNALPGVDLPVSGIHVCLPLTC